MSKKSDVVEEELVCSETAPEEDEIIVEEIIPEPEPDPDVPAAEFGFGLITARSWLMFSYARLRNVFTSVLFNPVGLDPELIKFALFLASQSVVPGGQLWVAAELYPEGEVAGFLEEPGSGNFRQFIRI
jgi:hypothetical protein